jgi:two-component system KDP operon response regulator KdpE
MVDGEPDVRRSIAVYLGREDYVVDVAGRGSQALSMLASHRADAVLMERRLVDTSGLQVVAAIRSWNAALPIIVVSSATQEQDIVETLDAGANDYVRKPFSPYELLARVRAVLRTAQPPRQILQLRRPTSQSTSPSKSHSLPRSPYR